MSIIKITDLNLLNKKVLIRSDLNVPIKNNKISSYARIHASLPTIKFALKNLAKVIVTSHLGRPTEGIYKKKFSLFPVFKYFKKILPETNIYFSQNLTECSSIKSGELIILENVRFNQGEKENSKILSKKYATLCDIFVMDAFGAIHRNEASTNGIIKYAKLACSGLLLESELKTLNSALTNPVRPMVAIVGGAKVSTKFKTLTTLAKISDTLIVGGGIANTFISIDHNIGKSLHDPKFIEQAKILKEKYNIFIPTDSRVSTTFTYDSIATIKSTSDIHANEEIMDFGDISIKNMINIIKKAKTILWNGPIGVFEFKNFSKGTEQLSKAIASSDAFSIAGGGDTLSVVEMFKVQNNISYLSTGGGSFLKFLEGNKFRIIELLEKHFNKFKNNNF
ncbi:phosphoglycerate kinase [Buchnera aphidicola str. Bp (Baizongia pistaciae)]|uniref:Phosphoglycerate kinase n=1 Tax=Buchnera aphidicola subsp. Baizongia pistaciae (strain Bp) TaxID=224915 RepID=PGK_BUCBP|nr:phosphoglycerate kinase [Buchnera aphidicola]P59461.1 RecName: Full=Phosphoglycerate kinase [Buchnera aphidicola str. Bp (Baizongia pistaciae)]AAO27112.1 phosphoglycerate kinase [Buchnera aphidicola str. Bp (Baizongia pistaciae)]